MGILKVIAVLPGDGGGIYWGNDQDRINRSIYSCLVEPFLSAVSRNSASICYLVQQDTRQLLRRAIYSQSTCQTPINIFINHQHDHDLLVSPDRRRLCSQIAQSFARGSATTQSPLVRCFRDNRVYVSAQSPAQFQPCRHIPPG